MADSRAAQPLVSIMILSYNHERFIEQALRSALDQEYAHLEVIVTDDASKDGTQAIIRRVAQEYPAGRLRYQLNPQNLGVTANSNVGLRLCKGEFVAFMGGDDVLLPGKIAQQIAWFLAHPQAVLCGHDVEWIDKHGRLLGVRTSDLVALAKGIGAAGFIHEGTPFAATSIMLRSVALPEYGFSSLLPLVSDWQCWIDTVGRDGEWGYIDGIWAQYRRHDNNVTRKMSWPIVRDVLMTVLLSLWRFRGRYWREWMHYLFVHQLWKRLQRAMRG